MLILPQLLLPLLPAALVHDIAAAVKYSEIRQSAWPEKFCAEVGMTDTCYFKLLLTPYYTYKHCVFFILYHFCSYLLIHGC